MQAMAHYDIKREVWVAIKGRYDLHMGNKNVELRAITFRKIARKNYIHFSPKQPILSPFWNCTAALTLTPFRPLDLEGWMSISALYGVSYVSINI